MKCACVRIHQTLEWKGCQTWGDPGFRRSSGLFDAILTNKYTPSLLSTLGFLSKCKNKQESFKCHVRPQLISLEHYERLQWNLPYFFALIHLNVSTKAQKLLCLNFKTLFAFCYKVTQAVKINKWVFFWQKNRSTHTGLVGNNKSVVVKKKLSQKVKLSIYSPLVMRFWL